jgi:hypothetical protein
MGQHNLSHWLLCGASFPVTTVGYLDQSIALSGNGEREKEAGNWRVHDRVKLSYNSEIEVSKKESKICNAGIVFRFLSCVAAGVVQEWGRYFII